MPRKARQRLMYQIFKKKNHKPKRERLLLKKKKKSNDLNGVVTEKKWL